MWDQQRVEVDMSVLCVVCGKLWNKRCLRMIGLFYTRGQACQLAVVDSPLRTFYYSIVLKDATVPLRRRPRCRKAYHP